MPARHRPNRPEDARELIAPYPPSDGAAMFLIETDSISLIGPTLVHAADANFGFVQCVGERVAHPGG